MQRLTLCTMVGLHCALWLDYTVHYGWIFYCKSVSCLQLVIFEHTTSGMITNETFEYFVAKFNSANTKS